MKKAVLLTGLFTATLVALFAQNAELPRLAVVEFSPNPINEKTKTDAVTVRNLVESQMVGTRKYQIITRDDIDKLLANQKIQVSSISSAENLKKLQLQNISYIVTGSVDAMGNDYAITVRVLDVSTGQFSHSANDFMGSGSRDMYNGINGLMTKFVAGMSATAGGTIVQGTVVSPTGISIEVSTDKGGDLYFQGEKITALWDNETHIIPIEKPGTYSLRLELTEGMEKTSSVTITTRGITKVNFSSIPGVYVIEKLGPAGGIVFYDKGINSGGWRYLEAAPASAEFQSDWNAAAGLCNSFGIGGFSGWRLPSGEELDLMYKNLKQKELGGFSNSWYWSSSQYVNNTAWGQSFSNGGQSLNYKNSTNSVRAVRAF
jgi:TolB-like protein